MTITDELIEQVARRMCAARGLDHDEEYRRIDRWWQWEDRARVAISDHIALAEIMPPDRATLLAVADAADHVGDCCGPSTHRRKDWIVFAAALRAKAG